ncbi:serine/threonine protein kinase [Phormidesmis priestleyi ULC007]|uniref:Serine/threonine protein kinase n=1 Tax=Phormidesmis priestleyi ULC007 TaxID=1920490 RepID=A0A2T1D6G9_9CYAN|nr:serine/threonine-protein kinase [Phormidesmis priestleyi]PSB16113.1 serine/threonine protein kinase [Phormidesmis priestleyi ULC007]PZO50499.1 MAG: serine/threonine protein kinase [Phormidesmis priestleyi]
MKLKPGSTLQGGKYLLNQVLGEEGFGATYLATQTLLNQAVVIKTLDASLQVTRSFPHLHQRFVEETRLLARSQHPSIVRVLDFFQEENLPFLVMEHVPGQTLAEVVKSKGALPEAEAIHYIRQIGSAIDTAHHNGLIHRNLNPQSIIRRPGTHLAVLVGFGIAHEVASAVSPPQTNIFDSNDFAPPDALWGADNRFAIDLYGLSAILYYLLSARAPGRSPQLDPEAWNPALKQAILQGMTSDLTRRPSTIAAWLRLLPSEAVPLKSVTAIAAPLPGQPAQKDAPIMEPVLEVAKPLSPAISAERNSAGTATALPVLPKREPTKPVVSQESERLTAPLAIAPAVQEALPAVPKTISASTTRKLAFTSMTIPLEISRHLPKFIGLTSAAAVSIGIGFGLALRFSAAQAPGASFFHPDQAFPSKDWKGTLSPQGDVSDVPIEKPGVTPGDYRNNLASPQSASSASRFSDDAPPRKVTAPEELIAPPIRSTAPRQSTITKPAPAVPTAQPEPIPTVPAPSAPPIAPAPAPADVADPVPPAKPSTGTTRGSVVVPTIPEDPKL